MPKKSASPFLTVGVKGGKPQGAATAPGTNPPVTAGQALGSAPPGRPVSNVGKYLIKPTAELDSGYEMINADPNVLAQVHDRYLKRFELPPALQPKYLRKPEVMDAARAKNISRGWRKPRSQQG